MKKLRNFYLNLPMRTKLLITSCLCSVILFAFCSVVSLKVVDYSNRKLLARSLATSVELSTNTISDTLENIESLTFRVLANDSIQYNLSKLHYLEDDDPLYDVTVSSSASSIFSELTSIQNQENDYISYIVVTSDKSTSRTSYRAHEELDSAILQQLVAQADTVPGSPVWVKGDLARLVCTREIREILPSSYTNLGAVIVGIDMEKLLKNITPSIFSTNICLLYYGSDLLYLPEGLNTEDVESLRRQFSDMQIGSYRVISFQDMPYFAVSGNIPGFSDWSYISLVPYEEYAHSIRFSAVLYYAVIILSLLLSIFLNQLVLNRIIRDLDNLVLKIQHFHGQKKLTEDFGGDYSGRTDELGVLHHEFDSMVAEIQQLIHVNYTNELLRKDAQLKALEMQINPHFLYNTLESINWRAKAGGSQEISQMVEALGSLLRKTLSHRSQKNTLAEELEIVQYYMTIMDLRFEDRLEYRIQAEPELLKAEIPTLTIQPLVENAANYALEEMTELCYINIEVQWIPENSNHFMILVRNTGTEFEDHLLEKLNTAQIRPRGLGIGLLNIEERLRLTFGDDFHFDFYNEDGFAVARIILPYRPA